MENFTDRATNESIQDRIIMLYEDNLRVHYCENNEFLKAFV